MTTTDPLAWGQEVATHLKKNWPDNAPEGTEFFVQLFLVEEYTMGWDKAETNNFYRNYYELVRRHGTLRRQSLIIPDDQPLFQEMELGQCYWNAYAAAVDLGYQYVEGYAQTSLMIVPHAWFEDAEGTIIDPTWAQIEGIESDDQITYFGVKFSTEFLMERTNETAHCSILGSDWMVNHPIIKRGLVMDGDVAVALNPEKES